MTEEQLLNLQQDEILATFTKPKRGQTILNPSATAAAIVSNLGPELDVCAIFEELQEHSKQVQSGDFSRLEDMLFNQACALQSIFTDLASRATSGALIQQLQVYMQLAFKAQNQCRQTLTTLAEMKHPKHAVFVKQQNNAINQQVNNDDRLEN